MSEQFRAFLREHATGYIMPRITDQKHRCDAFCYRFFESKTVSWCIESHKQHICDATCDYVVTDAHMETYETCPLTGLIHGEVMYNTERNPFQSRHGDATLNSSKQSFKRDGRVFTLISSLMTDEHVYRVDKISRAVLKVLGRTPTSKSVVCSALQGLCDHKFISKEWFQDIQPVSKKTSNTVHKNIAQHRDLLKQILTF